MASKDEAESKQNITAKTGQTGLNNTSVVRYKGREDEDLAGVILTWFIQVTGLAAAVTFGIFSVLSWTNAQHAKQQADTAIQQAGTANQQATAANLLALAALCSNSVDQVTLPVSSNMTRTSLIVSQNTTYNNDLLKFCNQLFPYAWTPLASAASNMLPGITITPPTASSGTPSNVPEPTSGASEGGLESLSTGAQVGLGVGITVGFVVLFITILRFIRWRRKLHRERNE